MYQEEITIKTPGRGTSDITARVRKIALSSGIETGLCHVFIRHTSASLMLCENADPMVRQDLERFFSRLVPDGDHIFQHTAEGPDDMPAHVRTLLCHDDLTLPVSQGDLCLGTWQGIYLWEHRSHPHTRRVVVTLNG